MLNLRPAGPCAKYLLAARQNFEGITTVRRKKGKELLVVRTRGNGDVFLATGVLPGLKAKFPTCRITFATSCGDVLIDNPYVDSIVSRFHKKSDPRYYDRILYLDYSYEQAPMRPIADSYSLAAGVAKSSFQPFIAAYPHNLDLPRPYVVMHAGSTKPWVGRDWRRDRFAEIAKRLRGVYPVVSIGQQWHEKIEGVIDLERALSKQMLASLIKEASFFIGIDSFPMHLAQHFSIPGVVFFGSVMPHLRLTFPGLIPAVAKKLPCLGCHHRNTPYYSITKECLRGDVACENALKVDEFWQLVQSHMKLSLL